MATLKQLHQEMKYYRDSYTHCKHVGLLDHANYYQTKFWQTLVKIFHQEKRNAQRRKTNKFASNPLRGRQK